MADIDITYNGSTIAQMSSSVTKTLLTAGKLCVTDIGVTYARPAPSYLGANPVKVMTIPAAGVSLSNTDFATWTPSGTATTILASSNAGTISINTGTYNYALLWFFDMLFTYDGTETNVSRIVRQCICMQQAIYKAPGGLTQLSDKAYNRNYCSTLVTTGLADYYNGNGTHSVGYSSTVGVNPVATAATFSNNTSHTPTLTVKKPSVRAICNNYLSTDNCAKIDKDRSYFILSGELWQLDKNSPYQGMMKNIVEMYNE